MNKTSLISQLKIEREAQETRTTRRRRGGPPIWPWVAGAVVALLLVGALGWFLINRPDLATVETATARSAWSGGAAQGGSLLDASGYVVARRQATVSSKITGKVAEVLIEEGEHVVAGQVIARLDDSNAKAALDQVRAQAAAAQASIKVAEVTLANAGPKYERAQRLHDRGYLSEQDPATSRWFRMTPPKIVPSALVSFGIINTRMAGCSSPWLGMTLICPFKSPLART